MSVNWPRVMFREFLRPNSRPHTLGQEEDANLVGMRLYGAGPFHRELKPALRIAKKTHFVVRSGDVIYNKLFAWKGTFGIVPSELDGMFVSDKFPTYELDRSRVDERFVRWYFRWPPLWEEARTMSTGSAALSKLTLNPPKFLLLRMSLPPLAEQRRVVVRIEELATQIHEARSLHQVAAEEADALSQAGAEASYQRLRDRVELRPLGTFCETITDGDHNTPAFSESGVRFIFVGNVSTGRLHFTNSKLVDEEYFRRLRPQRVPRRGDILYSAVGATLGIPAVVDSDEPFCFQRHIAILKPNRRQLDGQFGWHMLRSRTVFEKAWASTTGSAQPTIPLRAIRELPIPVPSLPEQRQIVSELDALQAEVDVLKRLQAETAAALNALLPAVLDRAFKGEL